MQGFILFFIFFLINITANSISCNLIILSSDKKIIVKSDCNIKIKNKKEHKILNNEITLDLKKIWESQHTIYFESLDKINLFFDMKKEKAYKIRYKKDKKTYRFAIEYAGDLDLQINDNFTCYLLLKNKQEKLKVSKIKETSIKDEKLNISPVIAIDAGHGGGDPGTLGVNTRIKEKDVTLNYARKLKKKFEEKGLKAILTRDKDVYLSLKKRVNLAANANADIFISIHADHISSPEVKGANIYTTENINRDHIDRKLFKYSSYVPDFLKNGYGEIFSNIIIDFYHAISRDYSRNLAKNILFYFKNNSLCAGLCRIKQASFAVLRRVDTPSILIEIGYLSNKENELDILSKGYQEKILDSIVKGVLDYLKK